MMIFLTAAIMIFLVSSFDAKALWIKVDIKYGHHEQINGKTFCGDFGMCDTKVGWGTGNMPQNLADRTVLPVKAEINDGNLTLEFKEKLDKKYMFPEGSYVFPISEDQDVKGKDAREFGLKKFTIPKGNYKFDGQTLKIRLTDVKPLDKIDKKDGTN